MLQAHDGRLGELVGAQRQLVAADGEPTLCFFRLQRANERVPRGGEGICAGGSRPVFLGMDGFRLLVVTVPCRMCLDAPPDLTWLAITHSSACRQALRLGVGACSRWAGWLLSGSDRCKRRHRASEERGMAAWTGSLFFCSFLSLLCQVGKLESVKMRNGCNGG